MLLLMTTVSQVSLMSLIFSKLLCELIPQGRSTNIGSSVHMAFERVAKARK